MSSTGSALSIFGSSLLPSRNHSFVYDGGESSTYSHESLEIGDSVESLATLGKLGYNPYMLPIRVHHKHEMTTSSSDDESNKGREYFFGRRKRSSGTTVDSSHDTPHYKGDNSNSSGDSDQLQQGSYRGNEGPAIPVHRKESICVSDIEKYSTDMEMDDKLASLQKSFGRVRYSSTGSVKICYSESSNTSMEDVSRNV